MIRVKSKKELIVYKINQLIKYTHPSQDLYFLSFTPISLVKQTLNYFMG